MSVAKPQMETETKLLPPPPPRRSNIEPKHFVLDPINKGTGITVSVSMALKTVEPQPKRRCGGSDALLPL